MRSRQLLVVRTSAKPDCDIPLPPPEGGAHILRAAFSCRADVGIFLGLSVSSAYG